MSMAEGKPGFEADVQVGKSWRYIDRNGRVKIEDGRLGLYKRKGDVIAEAPMNEVSADIVRGTINFWIGSERYILTPLRVSRAYQGTLAGATRNLARDISRLKAGKELSEQLLGVVEAEGGHIGRPDK
jgi:hypothetical protein